MTASPALADRGAAAPPLRLVFWETTAACNLACVHCRRLDVGQALARQDLDREQALALIDAVAALERPILVLSGGEPLTRPDLFELIARARQRDLPTALATNGTLIDDALADRLASSGLQRVAISIDGADPSTHDRFRGQPGALAAALAGFDRLRRRGMSLQINCTVTRHNVHQLDQVYQLAVQRGADALHLFMFVPVGCGQQIAESDRLRAGRYEQVLRWLYQRAQEGRVQVKATCAPQYYRIARQLAESAGTEAAPPTSGLAAMTRGCLAGTGVCFISHAGEVFPCGYLPVSAGNVLRTPLADIWARAEVFAALRDPALLTGKCGVCEYVGVCGGCRARAYQASGNYLGPEPHCAWQPRRHPPPS